jgi:hypothetical protein
MFDSFLWDGSNNIHAGIIATDVAMFNEIYMKGRIQQAGFHSPSKQSDALAIDLFISRAPIANPECMFNFYKAFDKAVIFRLMSHANNPYVLGAFDETVAA